MPAPFAVSGRVALTLGLVACTAPVQADPPPLPLAEAVERAAARSAQLAAQALAVAAARESALGAGRLPDPVLRLAIDNLPADGPDRFSLSRDFMTMRRIGLMQEITAGDKRRLRGERGARIVEREEALARALRAELRRDAALAWIERHGAERLEGLAAQQLDEAGRQVAAAESAYRGGRGSQADVFAAQTGRAAAAERLGRAALRAGNAGLELARWIGAAADRPLAAAPDPARLDAAMAALPGRLDADVRLAIAAGEVSVAESEAALARADRQPDWSVEIAWSQRGPAYSNMLSVGVSIPLQWDRANRQDRDLAARLAAAGEARARAEELRRARDYELRTLAEEWRSGRRRLTRYADDILPLAARRSAAALAAYRGGAGGLAAVLEARQAEIALRGEQVQLEIDTLRAWARAHFLVDEDAAAEPGRSPPAATEGRP